jgi:DNA modification methylase
LFNNLKDDSEVELGRRELQSLFGHVDEVPNFIDAFVTGDLPEATLENPEGSLRLQDAVSYELPYGAVQGFSGKGPLSLLPKLVRRLAYTREIYVIVPSRHQTDFEELALGVNLFVYRFEHSKVIRAVTNQYFLEKSQYISKLSRNKHEIDSNLATLLDYLKSQSKRIPATETMAVGRRLEDWFAIREEPSLYLTHYMHPYKGKFHPKMARALINYVCPKDSGLVLDNFSGSGTTLVEARSLGLNSVGVDINPLSALMSQVKVQCLEIKASELRLGIERFLGKLRDEMLVLNAQDAGQALLSTDQRVDAKEVSDFISKLPTSVKRNVSEAQILRILLAKSVLESQYGNLNGSKIHEFLLLGLSGAISDVSRRTNQDFLEVLAGRLWTLWGRVYLSEKLLEDLKATSGSGQCLVGDTRDLSKLKTIGGKREEILESSVDCIVNSPPYSTALDYIRNDLPQLSILNFTQDMGNLERELMGNPNLRVYDKSLQASIADESEPFTSMPDVGKSMLKRMLGAGRGQDAGRVLKFWVDMKQTLSEMQRVLKPGGTAAVVIGDNNIQFEKGSRIFEQIPNVEVLQTLGAEKGLMVKEVITRAIEKSMTGMIRNEAIIIFAK